MKFLCLTFHQSQKPFLSHFIEFFTCKTIFLMNILLFEGREEDPIFKGLPNFYFINMEICRFKFNENHNTDTCRFFLEGREREPELYILILIFIGKHMKILYLKFNQNRMIDEECGDMEAGSLFLKMSIFTLVL